MTAARTLALVGDIGGTNARFALVDLDGGRVAPRDVHEFASRDHASAGAAARAYLDRVKAKPQVAVIAAAGPVAKGAVHFTNLGWTATEAELEALGIARARLINDFESLALATAVLTANDVRALGPDCEGLPDRTIAVIGPGTGFGAAALARGDGNAIAMATEGGHISFAPVGDVEREVLAVLAKRFGHVSVERILSGPGMQNLHAALNVVEGIAGGAETPEEIAARGLAGEEPFARTLKRFCAILGSVAGDFALAFGALGGLYIAGGIAPAILPALAASDFRARFEAKGRFDAYLRAIPTRVITQKYVSFLGSAALAARLVAHNP